MLWHQIPTNLQTKLIGMVDVISQSCFHRRRFVLICRDQGLDAAFADWEINAPRQAPEFLVHLNATIEEIKAWKYQPFPGTN